MHSLPWNIGIAALLFVDCLGSLASAQQDASSSAQATPRPEKICHGCGTITKSGQHCSKCGREISREKLIELAKLGRTAALSLESRQGFASLRSHLYSVAMIDIVPEIYSQVVNVTERLKPRAIEPRTDGLSKQKVEVIDEAFVSVAISSKTVSSDSTPSGNFLRMSSH